MAINDDARTSRWLLQDGARCKDADGPMMTTVRGRATHKVILPTFCLAGKFSSSMGFLIDVYIFKMMG